MTMAAAPALPEHDASVMISEIYAALVIQSTLCAELHDLETAARDLEEAGIGSASFPGVDDVQLAAEEALALASHERSQRQAAQSKLRHLQAVHSSDAGMQQKLDDQKKQLAACQRELKDLRAKAQRSAERHAAATHGLRSERLQARVQRRAFGAHRTVQLAHELWVVARLQRALWKWHAKIVEAGIFELAHFSVASESPYAQEQRADDELAHAARGAALEARDAENLALRQRVVALEGKLALEGERSQALMRAAQRAGQASAALLGARRQNCEMAAQLASAHGALERRAVESTRSDGSVAQQVERHSPGATRTEW